MANGGSSPGPLSTFRVGGLHAVNPAAQICTGVWQRIVNCPRPTGWLLNRSRPAPPGGALRLQSAGPGPLLRGAPARDDSTLLRI